MTNRYLQYRNRLKDYRDMRGRSREDYESHSRDYSRGYSDGYSAASDNRSSRSRDYYSGEYDREYRYDYDSAEKEYEADLMNWIEKLKMKEKRFGLSKEEVIRKAEEMGVRFNEYNEHEFYAIYLAMATDFKKEGNDPHTYINMAKEFLEDDDIRVSPSEKVCIYLYKIVKGE